MVKTLKAREIAKLSSLVRQCGFDATFSVLLTNGKPCVLSDVRPEVTEKGNFSIRTICLRADGREMRFDGRYEFRLAGEPEFTPRVRSGRQSAADAKSRRRQQGET